MLPVFGCHVCRVVGGGGNGGGPTVEEGVGSAAGTSTAVAVGEAVTETWTPADLGASLLAWYKASSLVTIGDGNPISQWDDESGNDRHVVQATGASQPVVSVQSAIAYALFDGVDDFLRVASWGSVATPFTVAGVFELVGSIDDGVFRRMFDSSEGSNNTALAKTQTGNPEPFVIQGSAAFLLGDSDQTRRSWVALFNGASSEVLFDGVSLGTGNTGTTALTGITVGANRLETPTQHTNCRMTEVMLISGAVSGDDLDDLVTYLADFV